MPPGALLPRDWLLEQLSDGAQAPSGSRAPTPPTRVDLSIRDLGRLFEKRPSTVRAWVARGDFPAAYKLHKKEWRIPVSSVEAFQERQRSGARADRPAGSESRLSDWRHVRRPVTPQLSGTGREAATNRSPRGNAED
jgi:hypothetical protein